MIDENNRMIAEFMHCYNNEKGQKVLPDHILKDYFRNELKYHEKWDWLMPVIEKIATIKLTYENHPDEEYNPYPTTFGMPDKEGKFMVRLYCSNPVFTAVKLIDAAWLAVVDFLQWYTSENEPTASREAEPNKKLRDEAQ